MKFSQKAQNIKLGLIIPKTFANYPLNVMHQCFYFLIYCLKLSQSDDPWMAQVLLPLYKNFGIITRQDNSINSY